MSSFFNALLGNQPQQQTFSIYENAYLNSEQDQENTEKYLAMDFTSLTEFDYQRQVAVAYEPLENGQFSSDSKQVSPYTLQIYAAYTPFATMISNAGRRNPSDVNAEYRNLLGRLNAQCDKYVQNDTLLVILQNKPLFAQYKMLAMTSYQFTLSRYKTALLANMTFQEIRITSTQYGGLQQQNVTNPENSSTVTTGTQSPNEPTNPNVNGNLTESA